MGAMATRAPFMSTDKGGPMVDLRGSVRMSPLMAIGAG